jgi:hypothetical protein
MATDAAPSDLATPDMVLRHNYYIACVVHACGYGAKSYSLSDPDTDEPWHIRLVDFGDEEDPNPVLVEWKVAAPRPTRDELLSNVSEAMMADCYKALYSSTKPWVNIPAVILKGMNARHKTRTEHKRQLDLRLEAAQNETKELHNLVTQKKFATWYARRGYTAAQVSHTEHMPTKTDKFAVTSLLPHIVTEIRGAMAASISEADLQSD